MAKVVLRLLGECVVEVGGRELTPAAPHLFALALYLALERGRAVSRRDLERLLFPAAVTPRHASHNLRQLLYRLRRMGMPLEVRSDHIRLAAADLEDRFAVVCRLGYEERVAALAVAEPVMPGLTGVVAEEYLDWMERARDQLMSDVRTQLDADLHLARRRADWGAVAALARRVLVLDPLNETATLALAESLARQGSKSGALDLLGRYEEEVGERHDALSLPARLLRRRISEDSQVLGDSPSRLPFLGRGAEVEALQAVWKRARRGELVVHALVGETGIGKTRLAEEFLALVALDNSGVVVSHALQRGDSVRPLALFADLVPRLLTLPGAAGCAPESLPLLRQLAEQREGGNAIGMASGEVALTEGRLRYALGEILDSVATEHPLLLLIDNADWLDSATRMVLEHLQRTRSSSAVLFLMCHRTRALVTHGSGVQRIGPLSSATVRLLAEQTSAYMSAPLAASALSRCLAMCAGNPGHLELLARHHANGDKTMTVPLDVIHLTDSSLNDASFATRTIVLAVATFGSPCRVSDLVTLTGLDSHELLIGLHDAEERWLLVSHRGIVECRSELVAERSQSLAPAAVNALLHLRAAELLSKRCLPGPLSQASAWRIANHWLEAGESAQALKALQDCWQHAVKIGQPMLAVASIREAMEHEGFAHDVHTLLDELISTLESSGEYHLLSAALKQRLEHYPPRDDVDARRDDLLASLACTHAWMYQDAGDHLEDLKRLLRSRHLSEARVLQCARSLMIEADASGDASLAMETLELVGVLQPTDQRTALLMMHFQLMYHTLFGEREVAVALLKDIELSSPRSGNLWHYIIATRNCSIARHIVANSDQPYSQLADCFALCLTAGMVSAAIHCASRLTGISLDLGNIDAASSWARQASDVASAHNPPVLDEDFLTTQLIVALLSGRPERARAMINLLEQLPMRPFSRRRNATLSHRIRIRVADGDTVASEEDLQSLLAWHARACRFGRHDDEMEGLWCALRARNRANEATDILTKYLYQERREIRPPGFLLRTATAVDPVWDSYVHSPPNRGAVLILDGA